MEFQISKQMRALDALRELYKESSRRTLQHWIKGGRFLVDGKVLEREDIILEPGQTLISQETFRTKQAGKLKILFEDRFLLVVDKPASLLSVPLDDELSQNALSLLRDSYRTDQIFAVHRIDRETSGVLLFARGHTARDRLKEMFEKHDLEREYFAIVEGRLPQDRGTWRCNLKELPSYEVVITEEGDGKEAITHFEVLRRSAKYTYLRCLLETGRKHQIRVHCKRAGVPVLGDQRYGAKENPLRRLALHARGLSLIDPFTQRKRCFTSPIPFSFKKLGIDDTAFQSESKRSSALSVDG